MNSIMCPIGPEQLELFALEWGKIATFDLGLYNQSAPNMVTVNMSIDLR